MSLFVASPTADAVSSDTVATATSASTVTGSTFMPIASPVRLMDTRVPLGAGGPLHAGVPVSLGVTGGAAAIPTTASAVLLNITVVGPTVAGFVTVYSDGTPQPATSTVDFKAGETIANMAIVAVTDGFVDIVDNAGTTNALVDVSGYYLPDATGGTYTPTSPARLLDTRTGLGHGGAIGALGANSTLQLQVVNVVGGVPPDATSAVLNITAIGGSTDSFLTVYPEGDPRPSTSNVNFDAHETIASLVVVGIHDGGIDIWNHVGTADVVADLVGYYSGDLGGTFVPVPPVTILNTHTGLGTPTGVATPMGAGVTMNVPIAGTNSVPSNATAVVLHVTALNSTTTDFLILYAHGITRPNTSSINFTSGQVMSNLAITALGTGSVDIWNHIGTTDVVVDLTGYYSVPMPA
jgi:hypothetical protein